MMKFSNLPNVFYPQYALGEERPLTPGEKDMLRAQAFIRLKDWGGHPRVRAHWEKLANDPKYLDDIRIFDNG